jgi:CRP-like cAMP-binding protein
VIAEGRVGVYQDRQLLYSAGPKEVFGLLEVLARVKGNVEVRAEIETLALQLHVTTLLSVLDDHFVMTLDAIRALGRMLLATPGWLASTADRGRVGLPENVAADGHPPLLGDRAGGAELDLVDRIRLLQASDMFSNTRLDSLAEVAAHFEEFRAEPGTVLWQEDDPASWMVVLLDGRVESSSRAGLRFPWNAGTVPGSVEALAAAPRWYDAIAATPVTGLRLSAERFFDAMEDDFEMATDVLASLAARVRRQKQTNS